MNKQTEFEERDWGCPTPDAKDSPAGAIVQWHPDDLRKFRLVVWQRWSAPLGTAWREEHDFVLLDKDELLMRTEKTAGTWDSKFGYQSHHKGGDAVKLSAYMKRRLGAMARQLFGMADNSRFRGLRL